MRHTTTRTPEPQGPDTMPNGWPPESGAVGDHVRRWLAWYVLAGSILTIGGVAWTIAELVEARRDREALAKRLLAEKGD